MSQWSRARVHCNLRSSCFFGQCWLDCYPPSISNKKEMVSQYYIWSSFHVWLEVGEQKLVFLDSRYISCPRLLECQLVYSGSDIAIPRLENCCFDLKLHNAKDAISTPTQFFTIIVYLSHIMLLFVIWTRSYSIADFNQLFSFMLICICRL